MKSLYIYEAEYISNKEDEHFLYVDLGFRTWKVLEFPIKGLEELVPGTRLLIETTLTQSRPQKYTCQILKIL